MAGKKKTDWKKIRKLGDELEGYARLDLNDDQAIIMPSREELKRRLKEYHATPEGKAELKFIKEEKEWRKEEREAAKKDKEFYRGGKT